MKVVAVLSAIVCANLYFCPGIHGYADDPCQPSAHIECSGVLWQTYPGRTVIQDFSPSGPNSHLEGGMTYQNGSLTVPTSGRYYIYAQITYGDNAVVSVKVGDKRVLVMIHRRGIEARGAGSVSTGGVFKLNAGDVILLKTFNKSKLLMGTSISKVSTFFGAYMI